jgi:hypothetical protein
MIDELILGQDFIQLTKCDSHIAHPLFLTSQKHGERKIRDMA